MNAEFAKQSNSIRYYLDLAPDLVLYIHSNVAINARLLV